ncbi:enoyl-[acyl-carrier-protein] reductase, mitochondrial isoform X3 [Danio rerio]|uniref:Enoyl-[acyl-carrier-protein] reductase, mitochondrial isoform X3 n=1 Tax=Danio rerio TaxID=7955 RepID=A0AC58I7E4_DANRE
MVTLAKMRKCSSLFKCAEMLQMFNVRQKLWSCWSHECCAEELMDGGSVRGDTFSTAQLWCTESIHTTSTLSGNTVIQNASNSAVGQAVIQIAAALGLKTINIIRDRENCDQLMQELQSLGADYVVTEEEVMSSGLHQLFEEVPKPKLGLNCVGGLSGGLVLSNLDYGGTMVTYGGMAKRPLQIPAKSFIFHNVTLKGFWLTQWKRQHRTDKAKLTAMLDAVCELMRAGRLSAPNCVHTPFHQFTHALQATTQTHSRKHVLIM